MYASRPPRLRLDKRNGLYFADFYDADRSPARRRVSLHVYNKRLAEKQIATLASRFLDGDPGADPWAEAAPEPPPLLTVADAVARFDELRGPELAPRTRMVRRRTLGLFVATLPPELPIAALTGALVERFTHRDANGKTRAENSRHTYHAHVATLTRWCARQGLVDADPLAGLQRPALRRKAVRFITADDLRRLLGRLDEANVPMADLVRFTVLTGLRLGEVVAVRWRDVQGTILVVASDDAHHRTKSGHERTVPLVPQAVAALDRIRAARPPRLDTDVIFRNVKGNPYDEASTSVMFRRWRDRAGLPSDVSFHTLRKTCGVVLASAGVDIRTIQAILGHADIRLTGQVYTSILQTALSREMARAFDAYHL